MENKVLEALERTSSEFIDGYPTGNVNVSMTWEEYNTIKQALLKAQEQEQVLEIIFEKNVDTYFLKLSKDYKEFNSKRFFYEKEITQEEFDTLKVFLKNGIKK